MTLQQLEYIVALDKYRHFVKASESCGVTQATLSILVKKLEEELDTAIFDRKSHPIKPTALGERIIDQARKVLYNTLQIKEMVKTEKEALSGKLNLCIVSTVAPILAPGLISRLFSEHPEISLRVYEMRVEAILDKLHKAEMDMAVLPSGTYSSEFLEVPLFHEGFMAYVSPDDALYGKDTLSRSDILEKKVWTLHDGISAYTIGRDIQISDFSYSKMYEGGRISILVDLVDAIGGVTIIPELYVPLLSESRLNHVRPFDGTVPPRHISLMVRQDYVHERLLNVVLSAIAAQVPGINHEDTLRHLPVRL